MFRINDGKRMLLLHRKSHSLGPPPPPSCCMIFNHHPRLPMHAECLFASAVESGRDTSFLPPPICWGGKKHGNCFAGKAPLLPPVCSTPFFFIVCESNRFSKPWNSLSKEEEPRKKDALLAASERQNRSDGNSHRNDSYTPKE